MRAMVLRGKTLSIEEVERPVPGPGQVLARVLACGICGSDLHAARFMGDMMASASAGGRKTWYDVNPAQGIVMGHEFVAEVVETGPGAESFTPGTRVTSIPVLVAPESPSGFQSIGYSPVVPGAYGEYVVMSAPLLLRVPENLESKIAATTEPSAVGLHAVREAGLAADDRVLVMGAGPIGLMTLLWLKKEGLSNVAISDPSPERRALAGRLGADQVINPAKEDVADAFSGARNGAQPNVVFECVGVPGTLSEAMALVQVRGKVVVVGVCMQEDTIRPMVGINKQLTMKFVLGYSVAEYAEALGALADGSVNTEPLVTRTITLDELPGAFMALADAKDCKVIVLPNG